MRIHSDLKDIAPFLLIGVSGELSPVRAEYALVK